LSLARGYDKIAPTTVVKAAMGAIWTASRGVLPVSEPPMQESQLRDAWMRIRHAKVGYDHLCELLRLPPSSELPPFRCDLSEDCTEVVWSLDGPMPSFSEEVPLYISDYLHNLRSAL
jgi:hypothetical protein